MERWYSQLPVPKSVRHAENDGCSDCELDATGSAFRSRRGLPNSPPTPLRTVPGSSVVSGMSATVDAVQTLIAPLVQALIPVPPPPTPTSHAPSTTVVDNQTIPFDLCHGDAG
eukprot:c32716_g1_i1.p1 GENE.c32716_g1_i1~~c32716_g1_i1.p1  ORF type:complete len:113 (-),score=8.80 c32716_g1_i1:200-538(-)